MRDRGVPRKVKVVPRLFLLTNNKILIINDILVKLIKMNLVLWYFISISKIKEVIHKVCDDYKI